MNIKDKKDYYYQRHNMKKDGLSLVCFVALTAFAGLLMSNIGTTYAQKQVIQYVVATNNKTTSQPRLTQILL